MTFNFNTDLYADPEPHRGHRLGRRFRRHERFDDSLARTAEGPRTVILAPHGGGIERGTSELCLAVAGYHPANLPITPPAGVTYDYWMFEGMRDGGNADLHVTSTGCDDVVAVSLCAGALSALSLHGFKPEKPTRPGPGRAGRAHRRRRRPPATAPVHGAGGRGPAGGGHRRAGRGRRRQPVQHRQPHPARQGRPAGAQRAAARHDVRRQHPAGPQAHHHRGVLEVRGRVP